MTQPGVTDWIDVSVTVRHGMPHWPDNRPIVLEAASGSSKDSTFHPSPLAGTR